MSGSRRFATTRWSVVLAAGGETESSRDALTTLCATYWLPLYAYARRRGESEEDAQDLVQGFFAALLEKGWVKNADEERGRFRGFLSTAFRRHCGHVREHDGAQKRGGDHTILGLDFERGETVYRREPVDELTPERVFERRWALTVLETVITRLSAEAARTSRAGVFDALKVYLDGASPVPAYRDVADQLGMSVAAIKVAVHRLRRRYRELLRATIAETVDDPAEVDDEIRQLLSALRA